MRDVSRRRAREWRQKRLNDLGVPGPAGDELERDLAVVIDESIDEIVNTAQVEEFLEAVKVEAAHQQERWGQASDRYKTAADWYWLVGYLGGKALHSPEKRRHHIVSSAAALYNWFAACEAEDPGARAVDDLLEQSLAVLKGPALPGLMTHLEASDVARLRYLVELDLRRRSDPFEERGPR